MTAAPADADAGSDAARQLHAWVRGGKSFSGRERNMCFLNTGGVRFADVSAIAGLDYPDDARAACLADWDRDGDLDLWVANRGGPQVRLLRNDAPGTSHFLALRLEGVESNRDAIGARVEVHVPGESAAPLLRTVRAGDGFLSQSSKWLHFGLAGATRVQRLVVRWPNGQAEEFAIGAVDAHYKLRQGSGHAARANFQSPAALPAGEQPTAPSTDSARIWLASRPPLPRLPIDPAAGGSEIKPAGTPRLLTLWSRSCAGCVAELREWTAHAAELKSAGVEVVVASVDALAGAADDPQSTTLAALPEPFRAVSATDRLVDILQVVNDRLLDQHRPIPAPTSFLIDRDGRIAAIYKGRAAWATIAADLQRLDAPPESRRLDATPFAGRWHGPPREFRPVMLASALAEAGFADEALEYTERLGLRAAPDSGYAKLTARLGNELFRRGDVAGAIARYRDALQIDPGLATAHLNLAVALLHRRDVSGAERAFREAIRVQEDYAAARVQLAALLAQTRRANEAREQLQAVLATHPNHAAANKALAKTYLAAGDLATAAGHLEIARQAEPRDAEIWGYLGMAYAGRGDSINAAKNFEQALLLRPGWPLAADQLAWILATAGDPKLRNPQRAVELAEAAARGDPALAGRTLDTLAAAYAAAGRFPDAVATAEQALAAARRTGPKSLEAAIQSRLERYRNGRPVATGADREK